MRIVLAVAFFVHAVAHLPGFLVSWQLRSFPELPYRTTILANSVDVGVTGIRIMGVAWLLMSAACIALACAWALSLSWALETAHVVIGVSFVLCVLGWPDTRFGVAANAAILGLLFVAMRMGSFTASR